MFEPGQLVKCVDDRRRDAVKLLERGRIYTVALSSGALLLIEELEPPPPFVGFRASRFRPIPDHQIELFRKMLRPTTHGALVRETAR